ncbi:flagellin [Gluconacetobacter sacchari]|nr:flagellin [Gluconacetobacter sacchari]
MIDMKSEPAVRHRYCLESGAFSYAVGSLTAGNSTGDATTSIAGASVIQVAGKNYEFTTDTGTVTGGTPKDGNTAIQVTSGANSSAMLTALATQLGSGYSVSADGTSLVYAGSAKPDVSMSTVTKEAIGAFTSVTPSGGAVSAFATGAGQAADQLAVGFKGGVTTAVSAIQAAITNMSSVAQTVGNYSNQITGLTTYTSHITDALTNGVGALTDADMAAASAKLTSLQTKQQLAIKAFTIANGQSQNILSLFQ